ncbi:pyruvate-ferredoxin/flavodoxin oxidoreductase [Mariprofundus ferrinatatus]|uniref:Pyruvate-flavodoxin oxidoreductase n=1 Tax=Mariprofundus ferrinatatus TaxID=1921087 RepID=A0A2K8L337_9PROT|nr:pyruvate:ferredoxin (flavodoxin) oxidoreductase [Mariprofundus ferrinatatus]ATX81687.1 pyruvate-ferredoxin/flavodoxin oxidoreductase [Mariprofundus ferrinatatus]
MAERHKLTIEGNEAAAYMAHRTNEVIAIYPITPSSPMGEMSDAWTNQGRKNLWGAIPEVIEMQSEGGASGTVHGALQTGALTTTFTSSQGLLLMIPNMYKIAGELTSAVFHVAARSIAAQALSIFGDHSDVMSVRQTGFAMLSSNSVQEVMDFALIAQSATLKGRIPVVHFFDGFRTSHEVNEVDVPADDVLNAMLPERLIRAHRKRALTPDAPVIRGTSQNPDVYFQGRESVNPFYEAMPEIVQGCFDQFAELTGRHYRLFEYHGAADAESIIVLMGSGAETAEETVSHLTARGEKVGVLKVRLYRPFSPKHLIDAIPATVRRISVLDRTKEPGADGEPLYKDMMTALAEYVGSGGDRFAAMPRITGGRFGLSSKEFTPGMVKAVFDELGKEAPKNHYTIGIHDDLSHSSLAWDENFRIDAGAGVTCCMFYGLGSDGTVSANKNSIKIIGEETDLYAQGYFVYDSKKAGAVTISHLRFGPEPIRSTYLIGNNEAHFIACHQPVFLERYDMLAHAAEGAVFLLNTPHSAETAWVDLTATMQQQIIEKKLKFYVIDAYKVAKESGMGRRINTVMQTCFFAISGVLEKEEAIAKIKEAVEKTYGRKGAKIIERNFAAIDAALAHLHSVAVPSEVSSNTTMHPPVAADAPVFVREITGQIIAGRGDAVPVSMMPCDGTWPLGTAAYEKRNLALEIPVWDADLCIHCGKCPFVCPHAAIRSKVFPAALAEDAPQTFKHVPVKGREFDDGMQISYQVAPEDCTGCGLCVEICPARDKSNVSHKALNMAPQPPIREQERKNWDFFMKLPEYDREQIRWNGMKGAMLAQPLFEFSGACVGCGETPYIKLATQLFGDRMVIANATGCSSIYGGNLPTTPYTTNAEGRGPAWSNSLFEDNAEFGLGFRLAIDAHRDYALQLIKSPELNLDAELVDAILTADQSDEPGIHEQRRRVQKVKDRIAAIEGETARNLESVADYLVRKSVWIIGGDGWAYDIGFGGLDHVMASGRNVNILVLDTEVYSNTGGQMSKATPIGAVAKFAAGGKPVPKKDLSMIAMAYEHVYVGHVAFGAKDLQTLKTFIEAESYDGPSLIIAYSPCIAHGVDLSHNIRQQELAVNSGHMNLLRYDPRRVEEGKNPLQLDSKKPSIPYREFAQTEARFSMLWRTHPDAAEKLMQRAQEGVMERFHHYEQLANLSYAKEEDES